jgi:hypothetical protein
VLLIQYFIDYHNIHLQATIIFKRYSTACFIGRFEFRSNQALVSSECCRMVVLHCVMCSMLNCFFILRLYLTMHTLYLNYENPFHGHIAYLPKNSVCLNMNPHYGNQDVIHTPTPRVLCRDTVLIDKSHLYFIQNFSLVGRQHSARRVSTLSGGSIHAFYCTLFQSVSFTEPYLKYLLKMFLFGSPTRVITSS